MSAEEIKNLIAQGESETLEFKKSTAEIESAFKTVCAFLNGNGGIVVIGVNDSRKIVGLDVGDSMRKSIASHEVKIEPPIKLDISYPEVDSKTIVLIKVNAGNRAPYVYDGKPYQRIQSTTTRMPHEFYDELIASRDPVDFSWERFFAETDFDTIDTDLLLGIVRAGVESKRLPEIALREDPPKILERLNLMTNGRLNNAGVVLFGTQFMPAYPQCELRMAHFKGSTRKEFLDEKMLRGNVFTLLDEAMFFVKRNLPEAAKIEPGKLKRTETPLIPFSAVREAMINALCHRDYRSIGGSIMLAIYEDRMEIINNGGLLRGITIEQIKAGFSKQRNPIIADVFYKGCLIEKFGRGINEIMQECLSAGDPEPEFFSDNIQFKVTFRFPNAVDSLAQSIADAIKHSMGHYWDTLKAKNIYSSLTLRQLDIITILFISEGLKLTSILEKLKDPISDRQLRRDLQSLVKYGLVKSRGRAKKTEWFLVKNFD